MIKKTLQRTALRLALEMALLEDESVILVGEDIGVYGGAFQVTAGLHSRFPNRLLETPITESGFVGLSIGLALAGFKPITEIMFMDFSSQIVDQILNQAVKYRGLYGEDGRVPLIIRTPAGGYKNYGATHSQSLENIFASIHSLNIVYPYSCQDYYSLFLHYVRNLTSPVLFIENKTLYVKKGELDDSLVYSPRMRVIQEGKGVLCLSYGHTIDLVLEASKQLSYNPTVVDICSLKPLVSLDWLFEQVSKYNHIFIITESPNYASVAEHLSYVINKECFNKLKNPINILSSKDSFIPFSKELEKNTLISVEKIIEALDGLN